jgi:hypothetical protein
MNEYNDGAVWYHYLVTSRNTLQKLKLSILSDIFRVLLGTAVNASLYIWIRKIF